jgi:hypothetical protein
LNVTARGAYEKPDIHRPFGEWNPALNFLAGQYGRSDEFLEHALERLSGKRIPFHELGIAQTRLDIFGNLSRGDFAFFHKTVRILSA